MFEKLKYHPLIYIGIHFGIGYIAAIDRGANKNIFLILVVLAFYSIFKNRNQNEEAFLWAAYFAGGEVFFRMTDAFLSYEMGKYLVMAILGMGAFVNIRSQYFSISYFLYLFLLLIGIVFTDVPEDASIRKAIVFNISGPVVLFFSAFYFYRRRISLHKLYEALFFALLPIFSVVIYLYMRTPDMASVSFSGSANRTLSGGFGPNQVATVLGFGIFIFAVFLFFKKKITGFVTLDIILLSYFVYRGLLTFSRGGILTGVLAFIVLIFFMYVSNTGNRIQVLKYVALFSVGAFAVWIYTVNITSGMLENRYGGKNAKGIQKTDISSGRLDIIESQLETFYAAPWFGIGVGNGKYKRMEENSNITAASHNEITRLIEEHGLLGVIILLILFMVPLHHWAYANNYQRAFLISFFAFWFLTVSHSAMRIGFPGFIYGLSLIIIGSDEEN